MPKHCHPGTKSYSTICEDIKHPLQLAKLATFLSIGKLLQPFLVNFQMDAHRVPFLHSELVQVSALDPCRMADAAEHKTNEARFRGVIAILTEAGRFHEGDADLAMIQYVDFLGNVAVKCRAEFASFDTNIGRVDSLFYSHMTALSSPYT